MKTAVKFVALVSLLTGSALQAQVPPGAAEEDIGPLTLIPGFPIDLIFPNVVDPLHPKFMYFEGSASSLGTAPATLQIRFDYHLDPASPPQDRPVFSQPFEFQVDPTGSPIYAEWTIPFCPPWVSIELVSSNGDIQVQGVFVHECLPGLPDDTTHVGFVAALGLLGLGVVRRQFGRAA